MTQPQQSATAADSGEDSLVDNLIGGKRRGSDDRTLNRNPSDPADVIGGFARADEQTVRDAIAAANAAAPEWADFPAQRRFGILDRAGSSSPSAPTNSPTSSPAKRANSSANPAVRSSAPHRSSSSSPERRSATPERSSTRCVRGSPRR